jgi:OmpA family
LDDFAAITPAWPLTRGWNAGMSSIWTFARKPSNQRLLSWLGGGTVIAAAGIWVVITYLWPAHGPCSRCFLVFYDYDSPNDISDYRNSMGEQIVQLAAKAFLSGAAVKMQVNGYTDTSVSPTNAVEISTERAISVIDELIRQGVPREAMKAQGLGENDLRVPTGPGVPEPQNRRVEIVFE